MIDKILTDDFDFDFNFNFDFNFDLDFDFGQREVDRPRPPVKETTSTSPSFNRFQISDFALAYCCSRQLTMIFCLVIL